MDDLYYSIVSDGAAKSIVRLLATNELSIVVIGAGELIADDKLEPRDSLYIFDGDHGFYTSR